MVEDSEDDALLLLRELWRGGYEPEYQRVDTPEAMEKAFADPSSWDVIFSDYRMPRFGAPEALKMWHASGSEAPFIVVSGKIGEDVAAQTIKAGAYDYVMKDNLTRLRAIVERSLQEAREKRDLRRAGRELQRRDAILEAVRFAAERFLSETAGWEQSIRAVLKQLGEATGASRVYVFENFVGEDGELWGSQRYEWVATGVSAQMDGNPLMRAIPYRAAGYGRWTELLGRGESVYGQTRAFPQSEQPELREQGILSILIVPIFVEGKWWGQIGFDDCSEEREWSTAKVGALGAAAGTLGAAIRRRRIEEELRQSEGRYRAVIEQATDGIYLLDARTRCVLESNPSYQKMLGYTADELRGMEVYDFVAHPRENVDSTIERTLEEKRRFVGGRKYRRKDGKLVDVEVGVSVISFDGKEVICTIVRDVTERKRAEEALARSENRLRTIIETEPECVKVLGMDGSLLEMNPAGLSMIEADSLEQVRGQPVYEYIAPEHRTDFVALTERVLHGGSGTLEFELVGLKGTLRWLETHAVPLRDARGEIAGLLAITRDITERKKNEEALRQSERLYRAVIEQATENIFLVDVETRRIVESNPAFQETLGYAEQELKGMTLYDIVAADRESIDANVRRVLEQKDPFVGERKYRRKDGSLVDVEVSASTIFRDGRETMCVVAHDVTERKKNEEAQRFLAEASATLSSSLDYRVTLARVARLTVPYLADWCVVDILEEDDSLDRLALTHQNPEKVALARELEESYPPDPEAQRGVAQALRTGRPELVPEIPESLLDESVRDAEHRRILEELGIRSYVIVPLVARGRTLGAITLVAAESGRRYGTADLELAEELARRAALAVDNARLYRERSETARALQGSLLPSHLPDVPGVEVGLRYLPAGEADVGGDFYDIFNMTVGARGDSKELSSDATGSAWGVVIGDVCG